MNEFEHRQNSTYNFGHFRPIVEFLLPVQTPNNINSKTILEIEIHQLYLDTGSQANSYIEI